MSYLIQTNLTSVDKLQPALVAALQPFGFSSQQLIFQFINPDEKLGIDLVRQLQNRASQIYQSQHTVFFVLNLNQSSQVVQNALLKSLEEPPAGTDFILTATNLTAILPTVTSRCQLLSLPPTLDARTAAQNLTFWQFSTWSTLSAPARAQKLLQIYDQAFKKLPEDTLFTKSTYLLQLWQELFFSFVYFLDHPDPDAPARATLVALLPPTHQVLTYLASNVSPKNALYSFSLSLP